MKTVGSVLLGLVIGVVVGFVLSETIAIVGLLAFDRPGGMRYLPIILGVIGGAAAPFVARRDRRSD